MLKPYTEETHSKPTQNKRRQFKLGFYYIFSKLQDFIYLQSLSSSPVYAKDINIQPLQTYITVGGEEGLGVGG